MCMHSCKNLDIWFQYLLNYSIHNLPVAVAPPEAVVDGADDGSTVELSGSAKGLSTTV